MVKTYRNIIIWYLSGYRGGYIWIVYLNSKVLWYLNIKRKISGYIWIRMSSQQPALLIFRPFHPGRPNRFHLIAEAHQVLQVSPVRRGWYLPGFFTDYMQCMLWNLLSRVISAHCFLEVLQFRKTCKTEWLFLFEVYHVLPKLPNMDLDYPLASIPVAT